MSIHQRESESIPKTFRLSTYDYHLPPELVAQEPAALRDESRLMSVHRKSGEIGRHAFRDIAALLRPSDILVLNETKVVPVSLTCNKPTGGRVDVLVLDPAQERETANANAMTSRACMVRASKPVVPGTPLIVEGGPDLLVEEVISPGRVRIRFPVPESSFLSFLEEHGRPPLPPYIKSERRNLERDRSRYQTVYARTAGSVAAPTAGLHFTDDLLREIEARGIELVRIVLHVGPGTFTPVREQDIRHHRMESEFFDIPAEQAKRLGDARKEGRRIIAVGTTTVRTLESAALPTGEVRAGRGSTNLFIIPGYEFRVVQGMITNFHLPCSTLLMLVAAFGGTDLILSAYREATRERFRFYSYGDACLIID